MGTLQSVPTGGASGVSFQAPTAWMPPLASMIPPEEATSQVDDPVYEPTDFSPALLPTTHPIVADLDKIKKALLDGVGGTMEDVLGKITEVYVSGGMVLGEAREEAEATYNKWIQEGAGDEDTEAPAFTLKDARELWMRAKSDDDRKEVRDWLRDYHFPSLADKERENIDIDNWMRDLINSWETDEEDLSGGRRSDWQDLRTPDDLDAHVESTLFAEKLSRQPMGAAGRRYLSNLPEDDPQGLYRRMRSPLGRRALFGQLEDLQKRFEILHPIQANILAGYPIEGEGLLEESPVWHPDAPDPNAFYNFLASGNVPTSLDLSGRLRDVAGYLRQAYKEPGAYEGPLSELEQAYYAGIMGEEAQNPEQRQFSLGMQPVLMNVRPGAREAVERGMSGMFELAKAFDPDLTFLEYAINSGLYDEEAVKG
jgi:hypothetical protein